MNRKKLKLVVSAMSILLAVQSPGAVLADTGQETAVEAQVSTEETVSEPGTEEILNGMGTEITQESEGYQEEILPGTADEVLPGTGEEESQILRGTADIAEAQNPTVQEALDKAETIIQHNQGKNPPDFDYEFNLEYGKKYFQEDEKLLRLREKIDEDTENRMKE